MKKYNRNAIVGLFFGLFIGIFCIAVYDYNFKITLLISIICFMFITLRLDIFDIIPNN